MSETTNTIQIQINREVREIEARVFVDGHGTTRAVIDLSLVACRIGAGAKWHDLTECVVAMGRNGIFEIRNGVSLNRSASYFIWRDQIGHQTTKSNHIGSKID
jgi:hypothetical protein